MKSASHSCAVVLLVTGFTIDQCASTVTADDTDRLPKQKMNTLGSAGFRHIGGVLAVAYFPDGKTLASADGFDIRLWDAASGKLIRVLRDDVTGIHAVSISPDGTMIASAGAGIRLWDARTGKVLFRPKNRWESASGVAFAPNGESFASAGADGVIRLWDISSANEISTYQNMTTRGNSHAVVFSPDGSLLASGKGNTVRIWNVATGGEPTSIEEAHDRWLTTLAFTPNGKHLICGGQFAAEEVYIWDVATAKRVRKSNSDGDSLGGRAHAIALSDDGKLLVSVNTREIQVWDVGEVRLIRTITEYRNYMGHRSNSIAISPDGTTLAIGVPESCAVQFWDLRTGERVHATPAGHTNRVNSVASSPKGDLVATGSSDGTVSIWQRATGRQLHKLQFGEGLSSEVNAVTFAPGDPNTIAAAGYDRIPGSTFGRVKFWNAASGQQILSRKVGNRITAVAFSPDGATLAGAWWEDADARPTQSRSLFFLWDLNTGKELAEVPAQRGRVIELCFSPDGSRIASAGDASPFGTVRVWDTRRGKLENEFTTSEHRRGDGPARGLRSAVFSRDLTRVITSASGDDTLLFWDTEQGKPVRRLRVPNTYASRVALSLDGRVLASAGAYVSSIQQEFDHAIHLWDMENGRKLLTLEPAGTIARSQIFSPDGNFLISGRFNGTTLVWDVSGAYTNLGE